MANDSLRGRQVVLRLTNKSGGGVVEGDVVILSSATAAAFTTTTSAALATDMIGVSLETIANDGLGRVCFVGYVPKINLSAAASLGDTFATHTVAKQAAPAAARATGHFGQVLGTGTTPAAYVWGVPDGAAGGNVATDAIWDAKGDLAVGTGANTAEKLAVGTDGKVLTAASGETTGLKWDTVSVTGGRTLIGTEQTPTGTGTVTWSSIPATYKRLVLEYVAKGTQAAGEVNIFIYFNNDTTASNYRRAQSAVYAGGNGYDSGGDDAMIGRIAAANAAPATAASSGVITIINYAATAFGKQALCQFAHRTEAASVFSWHSVVDWESTSAIDRIDLVLSAGNYDTGSTLRLYGEA